MPPNGGEAAPALRGGDPRHRRGGSEAGAAVPERCSPLWAEFSRRGSVLKCLVRQRSSGAGRAVGNCSFDERRGMSAREMAAGVES